MISTYKITHEEMLEVLATWLKNHHVLKVPKSGVTLEWFDSTTGEEVKDCNFTPIVAFENDDD